MRRKSVKHATKLHSDGLEDKQQKLKQTKTKELIQRTSGEGAVQPRNLILTFDSARIKVIEDVYRVEQDPRCC